LNIIHHLCIKRGKKRDIVLVQDVTDIAFFPDDVFVHPVIHHKGVTYFVEVVTRDI